MLKKTIFLLFFSLGLLQADVLKEDGPDSSKGLDRVLLPNGLSLSVAGQYSWMTFSTPPTLSGSTGGFQLAFTYQAPQTFFGQIKSTFNGGNLSHKSQKSRDLEWYSEFLGGYCFPRVGSWQFTPYGGLGLEYLWDNRRSDGPYLPIDLEYSIYYAILGIDIRYLQPGWFAGIQLDCMPTFDQSVEVGSLSGASWPLQKRVGAAVHIPLGYQAAKRIWLELTPYYRFLPIGKSGNLNLSERNLMQWGAFFTVQFFL